MTAESDKTESPVPGDQGAASKRARERKAKLVLLGAIALVAGAIYVIHLLPVSMPDPFTDDLAAAQKIARDDIRPMLVLFWTPRVNTEATRHVLGPKGLRYRSVQEAIKSGNFVCVAVELDRKLDESDLAKEYKITTVPTLVVLSSMGAERDRLEGREGHDDMETMLSKATP